MARWNRLKVATITQILLGDCMLNSVQCWACLHLSVPACDAIMWYNANTVSTKNLIIIISFGEPSVLLGSQLSRSPLGWTDKMANVQTG